MNIRFIIREELDKLFNKNSNNGIFYHGTSSKLPFQNFSKSSEGTGIVSSGGRKYGGFFFTSEFENAEYYTEWFVAEVRILDIHENPINKNSPPEVMKQASEDNKIYIVRDVFDGAMYSDIVVVPHSQIYNIDIINWKFIGDKESYFESLDEFFGGDIDPNDEDSYDDEGNLMEPYIDQGIINSFVEMTGGGLDYLLSIPIFKEYYESK
jgi:hypothetical protein